MKIEDHVEKIRIKVVDAVRNTLDRCGITKEGCRFNQDTTSENKIGNVEQLIEAIKSEKSDWNECFGELVDDYAFTLFNRLVCLKVLEAHGLYPEMITQRQQHSGKAYSHYMWLESNSQYRDSAFEGLDKYIQWQFEQLADECDLFNTTIPLHMIPTAVFLKEIIDLINAVDDDEQIDNEIWKQGNILSQIYEIYNNTKKVDLKASGDKVEYDKVHVQSQIYTPEWVVKFLVDNSLGKMYLEMYPDSEVKNTHKIIGDFSRQSRDIKPLDEIKVIDPCVGSGNFLLYCFDLLFDMYIDQIENYGADYAKREIPGMIIEKNLHGIDLDERAVQLTKVGLFIKAKTKRNGVKIKHYNIVSASFRLPAYSEVGLLFDAKFFSKEFGNFVEEIWCDLQCAHKFGSLLKIDEKFEETKKVLKSEFKDTQLSLFNYEKAVEIEEFEHNFYDRLSHAMSEYVIDDNRRFIASETTEALTYLMVMLTRYDIVVSNPPYLESDQFGEELRLFLIDNYVYNGYKFNADMYDAFFDKNFHFINTDGYLAMVQPQSYMHVVSYVDLRRKILSEKHIDLLVDCKFAVFPKVLVDVALNIFSNKRVSKKSLFIRVENPIYDIQALSEEIIFEVHQDYFMQIQNYPLTYWIKSKRAAELLQNTSRILQFMSFCNGIQTGGNNEEFFRYYWEVKREDISENFKKDRKKWVPLNKGGDYNKWYGNQNLVCDWFGNGEKLRSQRKKNKKIRITSEEHYFEEGLSFSGASSKGFSVRYQPSNFLFEIAGKSVFMKKSSDDIALNLGFLNSKLCSYFLYAINPTVNFQTGNLEVVPYIPVKKEYEALLRDLVNRCIQLRKYMCRYNIVEKDFITSPVFEFQGSCIAEKIDNYLFANHLIDVLIEIYEENIDQIIFSNYEIPQHEIYYVLEQEEKYRVNIWNENICRQIQNILDNNNFFVEDSILIKRCLETNNSAEDTWFNNEFIARESEILETRRFLLEERETVAKDLLFEVLRDVLNSSENGMLDLEQLVEAVEKYLEEKKVTYKNVGEEIKMIIGKSLRDYLYMDFFENISSRCNVYPRMAKAPFIWHISVGTNKAIDIFVSIDKWNRDKLYAIKAIYLTSKRDKLLFRKSQISNNNTAQSIKESELIDIQLEDIETLTEKLDELIAEDYDPTIDGGICKNIAPLQDKRMLKADVLNPNQLKKYLKAEW